MSHIDADKVDAKTSTDDKIDYFLRGKTKADLGMSDSAIKDFSKAIDQDPENATAFYQRGQAYLKLQKEQDALADFKTAITLNPDHEQALNEIIKLENSEEEHDEEVDNKGNKKK